MTMFMMFMTTISTFRKKITFKKVLNIFFKYQVKEVLKKVFN